LGGDLSVNAGVPLAKTASLVDMIAVLDVAEMRLPRRFMILK